MWKMYHIILKADPDPDPESLTSLRYLQGSDREVLYSQPDGRTAAACGRVLEHGGYL